MTETEAPPPELTARQRQILEYIREFADRNGYCASIRELQAEFGIASPNGIVCHLKALAKKGFIRWERHTARTVRVVEVNDATR